MNREEAIHELQEDKRLYETEVCHAGDGTPDGRLLEALDMAIEAIRHDVIFEQIKWERDVALQTLKEHGIGLGQKCDSEVVSADAEPKWNCTANFIAEQLDRLRKMTDKEKWEFFKRFFEIKGGDDE